jgi:hypothetical protein
MNPAHGAARGEAGDHLRGTRQLRVGLELGARSARVRSMWRVEQPAVQVVARGQPLLARVDLAGKPVLLQALADPRATRGVYRQGLGHSYGRTDTGVLYVTVPFTDLRELGQLRIRLLDVTRNRTGEIRPDALAALFEHPAEGTHLLADVDAAELMRHPDWAKVAGGPGVATAAGRFEIYVDHAGEHRWRLLRGAEIVADSGEGYPTREACEADLRWVRAHAADAEIVSLDLPGGGAAPP